MRHWSCLLLRDILGLPDVSGYSILVQLQDSLAEPEPEETARGRSRILPSTEDAADRDTGCVFIQLQLETGMGFLARH